MAALSLARGDSAHRAAQAVVLQDPHDLLGAKLTASVGVTDRPGRERSVIALRFAEAAKTDFIRESIEHPTILLENTSLIALGRVCPRSWGAR